MPLSPTLSPLSERSKPKASGTIAMASREMPRWHKGESYEWD